MSKVWDLASNSWRLDALRGLAIIGVMVVHASQVYEDYSGALRGVFQLGLYGVELFFFLSGFLISGLYDKRNEDVSFKSFWKRRLARILPLWFLFGLLSYVIYFFSVSDWIFQVEAYRALEEAYEESGKLVDHPTVGLMLTLAFLGFVSPLLWNSTIPGGWSLQSEVWHYAFFSLFRARRALGSATLVLLGVLTWVATMFVPSNKVTGYLAFDSWLRLAPFSTLVFFWGGVLFSRWVRRDLETFEVFPLIPILSLGVLGPAVGLGLPFGLFPYGVMVVLLAVISVGALREGLVSRGLAFLGKYSYFAYFFHFFSLEIFGRMFRPSLILFLENISSSTTVVYLATVLTGFFFTVVLTYSVAPLSFRLLESPIIQWARRSK